MDSKQIMKQKTSEAEKSEAVREKDKQKQGQLALQINNLAEKDKQHQISLHAEEDKGFEQIGHREIGQYLVEHQRFRRDSAEMTEVKQNILAVDRFIDKNSHETMTPEVIGEMQAVYQAAIESCTYYCSHRNPSTKAGQIRMSLVRNVRDALFYEMDQIKITLNKSGDEMINKTVGEFMHLNPRDQIEPAVQEKDKKDEENIAEEGRKVLDLLEMKGNDHVKLLKEKKDKNGKKIITSPYLMLHDKLRSFPKSAVHAETFELNGTLIQLLQKADGSLFIVKDQQQIAVPLNADQLADHIESKEMENPTEYGRKNIENVFLEAVNGGMIEENTDITRIRSLCLTFLDARAGMLKQKSGIGAKLTNVSTRKVLELTMKFASKMNMSEKDVAKQLMAEIDKMDNVDMINGQETLEILKQNQEHDVANEVVFSEKKKEELKDQEGKAGEQVKWTENEEKTKNLLADLIYSQDTWTADNVKEEPGARLREVLLKHVDTLGILVSNLYRNSKKEPESIIEKMMDKLPVSFFAQDAKEAAGLKAMLKDKLNDTVGLIDNLIKQMIKENNPTDSDFVQKCIYMGARVMMPNWAQVSGKIKEQLEKVAAGDDPHDIMKKLADKEKDIDEFTADKMSLVQDTINASTKAVFGSLDEDKAEKEKEAEKKPQTEKELTKRKPDSVLENILKDAAMGKNGMGKFIKLVMQNYFSGVSAMDQRAMLASAFRGAKPVNQDSTQEEILANYMSGLLKGAGPLLQKMLQGLPTQSLPESIRGAIEDMKSNLAPIPEEIVKAQMADMVHRSKGNITKIEVKHSLGAASVGQAFLCRLYGPALGKDGQEVVIKLLRPDVRNKMMREKQIMLDCAGITDESEGMLNTYKGQLERIMEEMDLTIEASNCEKGKIYNDKKAGLHSMEVSELVKPTVNSLVLKKAPGTTVDQYYKELKEEIRNIEKPFIVMKNGKEEIVIDDAHKAQVKELKAKVLKKLESIDKRRFYLTNAAKSWLTEGIYKQGFYHGDLHSGNMIINDEGLTIIDYGNATQLTKEQQEIIIQMCTAATAEEPEYYLKLFHQLLGNTKQKEFEKKSPELLKMLKYVFSCGSMASSGMRIAASLIKAQEMGFELPPALANFSSGQLRLQNTVDELQGYRDELSKFYGKLDEQDILSEHVNNKKIVRVYYKNEGDIFSGINNPDEIGSIFSREWGFMPGIAGKKEFYNSFFGKNKIDINKNGVFSKFSDESKKQLSLQYDQIFIIKDKLDDKNLAEGEMKKLKNDLEQSEKAFYVKQFEMMVNEMWGEIPKNVYSLLKNKDKRKQVEDEMKEAFEDNPALKLDYDDLVNMEKDNPDSEDLCFRRYALIRNYVSANLSLWVGSTEEPNYKEMYNKDNDIQDENQKKLKEITDKYGNVEESFSNVMGNVILNNRGITAAALGRRCIHLLKKLDKLADAEKAAKEKKDRERLESKY